MWHKWTTEKGLQGRKPKHLGEEDKGGGSLVALVGLRFSKICKVEVNFRVEVKLAGKWENTDLWKRVIMKKKQENER